MSKAIVLVRNVKSQQSTLNFQEFMLTRVSAHALPELRKQFGVEDIRESDWLLEKQFSVVPEGPMNAPSGVGGIPIDLQMTLLLLRLWKAGDVSFVRQRLILDDGTSLIQYPYRVINELNGNSVLVCELEQDDAEGWQGFADGIRSSQSWSSGWFSAAGRFFLEGGSKEFNPQWSGVDRIVDYVTALEATFIPEKDFLSSRLRNRIANLLSNDRTQQNQIRKLVGEVYALRSTIVHGEPLSKNRQEWLIENIGEIELLVRQSLVAAVQNLPPDLETRTSTLVSLFDPTDQDRVNFVVQRFQELPLEMRRSTWEIISSKM